jgi:hypothetical protein
MAIASSIRIFKDSRIPGGVMAASAGTGKGIPVTVFGFTGKGEKTSVTTFGFMGTGKKSSVTTFGFMGTGKKSSVTAFGFAGNVCGTGKSGMAAAGTARSWSHPAGNAGGSRRERMERPDASWHKKNEKRNKNERLKNYETNWKSTIGLPAQDAGDL